MVLLRGATNDFSDLRHQNQVLKEQLEAETKQKEAFESDLTLL